ncbi:MAG: exonuclease domain-containing protein [Hydrogenophilus sp.]|nr:exonuclease domain-containing protein [Hydrogenophilus sp.]
MDARLRFWSVWGAVAAIATLPFLLTGGLVWLDLGEEERRFFTTIAGHWLPIGSVLTIAALVAAGVGLERLFRIYVRGLAGLAEQLDVMRTAHAGFRVEERGPPEVRRVAQAANRLAAAREEALAAVEERVAAAQASLATERNRLAALMAELDEAVVVCNREGRVLLYNEAARRLAERSMVTSHAVAASGALGLGRTLFTWVEPAVLGHALDSVTAALAKGERSAQQRFAFVTPSGRVVRARVAPVVELGRGRTHQEVGFVLLMHDATEDLAREAERSQLLFEMTERNRGAVASILMAVEVLTNAEAGSPLVPRLVTAIAREAEGMRARLVQTAAEAERLLAHRWPLEPIALGVLVEITRRFVEERVGVGVRVTQEAIEGEWVAVDLFLWLHVVAALVERLRDDYGVETVTVGATAAGTWAHFDVRWQGGTVSFETVAGWELEAVTVRGARYPFSVREVLERHGGTMWFDRVKARQEAVLRVALPVVAREEQSKGEGETKGEEQEHAYRREEGRPLSFDFDLFAWGSEVGKLEDRPLSELVYTVFDTETTGLRPSEGDEIIQIGAVRIVNGRVRREEAFEQLIDPRRPLSPESIAIHGITPEMLIGQPTAEEVLPAFHRYAQGSVLVAHNAAFDMRFLELKEKRLGIRFDQPVLDTLLLAYFLFPNQESNRLEALADRFGIAMVGRHTALGDALVTAEAFVRMLPLLAERGVVTLRAAREAAQQTYLAKLRY